MLTRWGLLLVTLAMLLGLACGPAGDPALRGGVIAPALERPAELSGLLQIPAFTDEVVFPWSEVTIETSPGELTLGVLVANTSERRHRGLMHWHGLPPATGMIFIWEETQPRSGGFWNENVPIDLHVAWLDRDGTILEFSTLLAEDRTSKQPSEPYFFALEMPRGGFEALGVAVGDRVRIPQTLLPED